MFDLFEIFRKIWLVNGILIGMFVVLAQIVGIAAVVEKVFEKKVR